MYLHHDPCTKRQLGNRPGQLKRQRMDFLLLFPRGRKVVLEVVGVVHYAEPDGTATTDRYGAIVAEDRAVKLAVCGSDNSPACTQRVDKPWWRDWSLKPNAPSLS